MVTSRCSISPCTAGNNARVNNLIVVNRVFLFFFSVSFFFFFAGQPCFSTGVTCDRVHSRCGFPRPRMPSKHIGTGIGFRGMVLSRLYPIGFVLVNAYITRMPRSSFDYVIDGTFT